MKTTCTINKEGRLLKQGCTISVVLFTHRVCLLVGNLSACFEILNVISDGILIFNITSLEQTTDPLKLK